MLTGVVDTDAAALLNESCVVPPKLVPFLLLHCTANFSVLDARSLAESLINVIETYPSELLTPEAEDDLENKFLVSEALNSDVPVPSLRLYASTKTIATQVDTKFKIWIPALSAQLEAVASQYGDPTQVLLEALLKLKSKVFPKQKMATVNLPPSMQPSVPPFDEHDVAGWLANALQLYLKFGLKEPDVPFYLGHMLPPAAQPVHQANKTQPWAIYSRELAKAFTPAVCFDSVRQTLLAMRQSPSETFRSFVYRVKHASRVANGLISDAELLRIILQILPREDATLMMSQRCSTLPDFIEAFEAVKLQHQLVQGPAAGVHSGQPAATGGPGFSVASTVVPSAGPAVSAVSLLEELLACQKAEKAETDAMQKLKVMLAADNSESTVSRKSTSNDDVISAKLDKLLLSSEGRNGPASGLGNSGWRGRGRGGGGGFRGGRGRGGYQGQGGQPNYYVPLEQYRKVFESNRSPHAQYINMPLHAAPMGSAVSGPWAGAGTSGGQQQQRKRCFLCDSVDHLLPQCPHKQHFLAQLPRQ